MKPTSSRLLTRLLTVTALALPGALCVAQTTSGSGPVLTGKGVTEEALTKALVPGDDGSRTRSLRIGPAQQQMKTTRRADEPSPSGAQQPGAGAASLLITFETNSTAISSGSISALDKLGRALKSDQLALYRFDVEGHADPRGNHEDNLKLSQGRAESVVEYLVSKHGIESARLRPIGKGDSEPVNTRNPAAAENRRVTVRNQSN
ncbi:MAG: OmpA family protein [Burkholderiaceae bacterium]|nr:OmpA family protein [Burkholderiaceae bacterium]